MASSVANPAGILQWGLISNVLNDITNRKSPPFGGLFCFQKAQ
jgi:hypothetical protein